MRSRSIATPTRGATTLRPIRRIPPSCIRATPPRRRSTSNRPAPESVRRPVPSAGTSRHRPLAGKESVRAESPSRATTSTSCTSMAARSTMRICSSPMRRGIASAMSTDSSSTRSPARRLNSRRPTKTGPSPSSPITTCLTAVSTRSRSTVRGCRKQTRRRSAWSGPRST